MIEQVFAQHGILRKARMLLMMMLAAGLVLVATAVIWKPASAATPTCPSGYIGVGWKEAWKDTGKDHYKCEWGAGSVQQYRSDIEKRGFVYVCKKGIIYLPVASSWYDASPYTTRYVNPTLIATQYCSLPGMTCMCSEGDW